MKVKASYIVQILIYDLSFPLFSESNPARTWIWYTERRWRSLENDQSDEACGGLVVKVTRLCYFHWISKALLEFPLYLKVFSFFNFQLSVTLFVIKVVFCFAMFACVVLHTISLSVYELRLSVGYTYFNGSLTWAAEDLQASLQDGLI